MSALVATDLHAHYGKSHVLQGVSFSLRERAITAVLGRNGSGRSTMLKALMGIVRPSHGSLLMGGRNITGLSPYHIARLGLGYVPEDRQVFPNLSVIDNLKVGQQSQRADAPLWTVDDMFDYFPRLRERYNQMAGTMSGGEQQMLTLCRSLMGNPNILLVDEPTEGLAPQIVERLSDVLRDIAARGVTILLVEQKLTMALSISEHVLVMGHGYIVLDASIEEFKRRDDIRSEWLDLT